MTRPWAHGPRPCTHRYRSWAQRPRSMGSKCQGHGHTGHGHARTGLGQGGPKSRPLAQRPRPDPFSNNPHVRQFYYRYSPNKPSRADTSVKRRAARKFRAGPGWPAGRVAGRNPHEVRTGARGCWASPRTRPSPRPSPAPTSARPPLNSPPPPIVYLEKFLLVPPVDTQIPEIHNFFYPISRDFCRHPFCTKFCM